MPPKKAPARQFTAFVGGALNGKGKEVNTNGEYHHYLRDFGDRSPGAHKQVYAYEGGAMRLARTVDCDGYPV